jgi:ABC-type transporter Mla maintaining outer membrane lipid asymmetry ATPase subunit MlaF
VSTVLRITNLVKDFRGLRPLRIERLSLDAGQQVAVVGLDQPAAETLVNLVTGASLPDAGVVEVFGRSTADITDSEDWLSVVDRFGILTERAVLLDSLTALQNLALPFSLDIEPPSPEVRAAATALAADVGLAESDRDRVVAGLDSSARLRLRLGRALALQPQVLLLEHATASVERSSISALARMIRDIATRRGLALLALTADAEFAGEVAARVLTLAPATGRLTERRRRWFR